jgi:predicted GIY-YIG superfamily endonuclease
MGEGLFNAILKRHIGKGLRHDCPCSFCITKRIGTAYIGFTRFPIARYDAMVKDFKATYTSVHTDPELYWTYLQDIAKDAVEWERERKRKIVRSHLRECVGES